MMRTVNDSRSTLRRPMRRPLWGFLSALALSMLLGGAVLASPDAAPAVDYDYDRQELRVGVWLDRDEDEVYRRGDDLTVSLQTNGDAYVVVYRIDAEGRVSILWPRSRMDDGFVFGGHEYALPVSGAKRIRVSADEGMGYVEAVASTYPFDLRDLAIDFHHEQGATSYDFYVAGDPFLAMNEVNYAVTGLEDTADFVVTNYAAYYIHEKVDHPRYLCNQCHYDDDVAYDPYHDHCTLEISYDYGWSNDWYIRYGYYPVYWHPTYVYYDPWTWRPWVNYWYYPRYTCAPYPYYSWGYNSYVWYDSPYYRGDVYWYGNSGRHKYNSLVKYYDGGPRTKTREYGRISPAVKNTRPGDDIRVAMKTRTPVGNKDIRTSVAVKSGVRTPGTHVVRGEAPIVRTRPDLTVRGDSRSRPGLRVRDSGRDGVNLRPAVRHTSGGTTKRPTLNPVSTKAPTGSKAIRGGTSVRGGSSVGGERPVPNRGGELKSDSRKSQGTIRTVEPRKKGTRVWNRGSSDSGGSRKSDGGTVRDSRSRDSSRSGGTTVRPRPSDSNRKSSSKVKSTPKKSSNSGNSKSSSPKVRSKSSSSGSSAKSGSSSRSGSSGSGSSRKSSGGSSKRSSGGSRSR